MSEPHLSFDVPSEKGTATYRVCMYLAVEPGQDAWTCTCPDYRFKSQHRLHYRCKHILLQRQETARMLMEALEEGRIPLNRPLRA